METILTQKPIDSPVSALAAAEVLPIGNRSYPCNAGGIPPLLLESGDYALRFARNTRDLDAVCRLRFEVYNLELNEGLDASYRTHRDIDEFDAQCHHLMVERRGTGETVGTYRLQTGSMASLRGGFYSAQEFDLSAFPEDFTNRCVEVGRACIHREHRNGRVLQLLWKGLARYMDWNGKRHLFGCCSLAGQDPAEGIALFRHLSALDLLHPVLRALPMPEYLCEAGPAAVFGATRPEIPRLFQGYLNLGGLVCGEPALDRRFKTIDFLVTVDIDAMPAGVYRKMLA
jgi:putative hemolysin